MALAEKDTFPTTCKGLIEGHAALKKEKRCQGGKLIDGPCAGDLKKG